MIATLLAAAFHVAAPPQEPHAQRIGADEVRTVELTEGQPALADRGPSRAFSCTIGFSGTLHVWATSEELDPFLRVEAEGEGLATEDDDGGGGTAAHIELQVERGQVLRILAGASTPGELGALELCTASSPESEVTRAAAREARESIASLDQFEEAGELEAARGLAEEILTRLDSVPGAEWSAEVAGVRFDLGMRAHGLGARETTRECWSHALEHRQRTLPDGHSDLQAVRFNLALALKAMGDPTGARDLLEKVLEVGSRALPDDHPFVQKARMELALALSALGDLRGALELEQKVLEILTRRAPGDHPDLQRVRMNLAATMSDLGDLRGALELQEKVLEVRSRTLPDDDPGLRAVRLNMAGTMHQLGDLQGARELGAQVLAICSRTLPDDHPHLRVARQNLAGTLYELGDLHGARALQELDLEVRSRSLPDNHLELQSARLNLAATMNDLGDLHGARELQEKALEVLSRALPDDHPHLQAARGNLASTMKALGDHSGVRELEELVLEARTRTLPDDHPALQWARLNLASTIEELGDLAGARKLEEKVLEVQTRTLPEDHPHLQAARCNLAGTMRQMGDLQAAQELEELVLEVLSRTLPDDHPDLQLARRNLAWTRAVMLDEEGAVQLGRELAASLRRGVREASGWLGPRELEERVFSGRERIDMVLSMAFDAGLFEADPGIGREAIALVESSRAVGLLAAALPAHGGDDAELENARAEEERAAGELARRVRSGEGRDGVAEARRTLDAARRDRVRLLLRDERTEALLVDPTPDALAGTLGEDEALVSFWSGHLYLLDRDDPSESRAVPTMLAFVVRHDGSFERLGLGDPMAIEEAVERWRDAIRAPLEGASGVAGGERGAQRGKTLQPVPGHSEHESGEELRRLVFDPLRPALGGARRLVVAVDGPLFAVPLDALPEDEGVLGESFEIELRAGLWELLWPEQPVPEGGALVALGGARFDPRPGEAVDAGEPVAGSVTMLRGGAWERGFAPLPFTAPEARAIAALLVESHQPEEPPVVLLGDEASRESLVELAPRARWLHLATHGWFAPESVISWADSLPLDAKAGLGLSMSRREQVRGTAPMLLCGLALSGANLPPDELGRVPGLLTAEELATLDLSGCELAVLSACDTNVGVHRAGQGVASLQKALQMAGARSVITSLWKVPDEATKELMVDFYRRIWVQKKPKARALWEAKMRLRDARDERGLLRYRTRDWAAWVLTGDPD